MTVYMLKVIISPSYDSGSMEPAFYRGDLLLLTNHYDEPIRAGEIVVFKIKDRDIKKLLIVRFRTDGLQTPYTTLSSDHFHHKIAVHLLVYHF